MKLLPPEPYIELYEDGFDGKDILGRGDSGKQLSELIERIEDPIVVALDGLGERQEFLPKMLGWCPSKGK